MKKPAAVDPKSKAKKARARPETKPEGDAAPRRADRPAFKRGGAVKKGSTVNIVIAPQGGTAGGAGGPGPAPMPPRPMPMPPPGGPGPGPMPPPGAGPGMPPRGLGASPMGPGPMGPPPGPMPGGPGFARGGHVMAGAGTGLARLQRSR